MSTINFSKTIFQKKNVPPGYSIIEKGKKAIIVKDDWKEVLFHLGITAQDFFSGDPSQKTEDYCGRGALKIIPIPGEADERILIRHFRRGGKIQKLIHDLYWGRSRPLRELWVGCRAREKGVPAAEIVAACHTKVVGKFHRGDIATREIAEGKDLATYLKEIRQPLTKKDILKKRRVIKESGALVRSMHDAGIFHGDLNLKNIILQTNKPRQIKCYLIDFDKSFVRARLREHLRIRNLLRLNRSAEKFKNQGLPITRTDALRFLSAYFKNSPDLKARFKKINRWYKYHMHLHRWGEKLSKLFLLTVSLQGIKKIKNIKPRNQYLQHKNWFY